MSSTYFIRPTIPSRYLRELMEHSSGDAHRMLAEVGLPREANRSNKFRASVEQFERLHTVTSRFADDELFGYLERKVPRGTYAVLMRLATGSRDLASFFESVTRLYALFNGGHRPFRLECDR